MSRLVVALCTLAVLAACSGPAESAATELWPVPEAPPEASTVSETHPLRPVVEALERADCGETIAVSSRLMGEIRARVATDFHGDAAGSGEGTGASLAAAAMRGLLDEYVYSDPPLLELGPHGFHFPHWWSGGYADCLAAERRYAEAGDVYALMLQEEVDAATMWRLALVYAWGGREVDAIGVLEAWPSNLTAPSEMSNVLERLRRGEALPHQEPAHQGGPD